MRKTVILFIIGGLFLAACSPAVTPTVASVSATVPTVAATTAPAATTAADPTSAAAATVAPTQDSSVPTDIPIPEGPATCAVSGPLLPTAEPTISGVAKAVPAVTDKDWILGKADAPITFVEYSDFQCPYCAQLAPVLEQIVKDDPDIRVVFRYFPLPSHSLSLVTAAAAEAAGVQGKFWEYYTAVFAGQSTWTSMTEADATKWLVDAAGTLGLDKDKFTKDMKSDTIKSKVEQAQKDAMALNIPYTPFLMINGEPWESGMELGTLETLASLKKVEAKMLAACPPMTVDANKKYTATIKTDKGDIVVELYPKQAPWAVNSFVYLAQQKWFDGVTFHRVIQDFVAQAGDPSGTGYGGPGYLFGTEISSDLNFDQEGVVGMARGTSPQTNGSQFFITLGSVPTLDGKYTVFGKVTSGMDVVKKLTQRNQSQSSTLLPPGDKINSISITIE